MSAFAPGLDRPHHSGYVVDSIEATVERLVSQLGAGPFILIENVPLENVRSGDQPAQLEHSSAFGSLGGYPIELMEVANASPERVETKWDGPLPRLHHIGYALDPSAADAVRAELAERGAPAYLSSQMGEGRGSFHDTAAALGHDLEVQNESDEFRQFFAMVLGAAEGWDGAEPLRPLG